MITAHSETSKLLLLTILSSSNSIVCFNANGTSRSLKILKFYIDFKFLLFRFRFSFSIIQSKKCLYIPLSPKKIICPILKVV